MTAKGTNVTSIGENPPANEKTASERAKPKTKAKIKTTRKASPASAVGRPNKILPSDRIAFLKQLDILRAWAAASGPSGKVVSNNEVAGIVKMQPSTVSMGNAFFGSIGLLLKADGGYIPAPEVMSFLRAYEWSPETAFTKLVPIISKTWF